MTPRGKTLIRVAGLALMLAALVFVGREIAQSWETLADWRPGTGGTLALVGLTAGYALALLLTTEAWHRIVTLWSPETRRWTYASFLATAIAKYVPGNVVHLLGRALWLRGRGLSDRALGEATLLELAAAPIGAGVALGALALLLTPPGGAAWPLTLAADLAPFGPPALGLAGVLGALLLRRFRPDWPLGRLLSIVALWSVFMGLLGTVFWAVLTLLAPVPWALAATAGVAGWLVGYLTPGAPGGIGTREATLILLLGSTTPEGTAVLAAALFRLVTVAGDALAFAGGYLALDRYRRPENLPDSVA